ncbi:hypothetical protein Acr_22g0006830 [Actinidia rufa]|uniref:Uncharacterized protein n=1 Tax=Actinidia rufa TaxID=165716 RepID=A0A7J0GKH5_9ERIC|nr:hypothetical protein Acr_22g0006830 [Actinidia rufa]
MQETWWRWSLKVISFLTVNGEVKTGEVEIGEINLIFKFISSSISPHPQSDGRDENHGRGENHGGCGQHPRKSELNELISLDKVSDNVLTSAGDLGDVITSRPQHSNPKGYQDWDPLKVLGWVIMRVDCISSSIGR